MPESRQVEREREKLQPGGDGGYVVSGQADEELMRRGASHAARAEGYRETRLIGGPEKHSCPHCTTILAHFVQSKCFLIV